MTILSLDSGPLRVYVKQFPGDHFFARCFSVRVQNLDMEGGSVGQPVEIHRTTSLAEAGQVAGFFSAFFILLRASDPELVLELTGKLAGRITEIVEKIQAAEGDQIREGSEMD